MKTASGKKMTCGTRIELIGDKYAHVYTDSAEMIAHYTDFLDKNPECGNYSYDEDMLVVNIVPECIPIFDSYLYPESEIDNND